MYSRRQFLGYGSAAFIAASGRVFGVEAPSNRVRLAIVGCHELCRGQRVMKAALRVRRRLARNGLGGVAGA